MTLFSLDGHPIDGQVIRQFHHRDGTQVMLVPGWDTFTFFYVGNGGNVLIDIAEFETRPGGVVLLENTTDQGKKWSTFNATKIGRGMATNATAKGPARFRAQLDSYGLDFQTGLRVRMKDLSPAARVKVSLTFAGGTYAHTIRTESDYVIQEQP